MLELEVRVVNGMWRVKQRIGQAVHNFFTDEKGDTNFISIVIILVIVVALAALFRKNIAGMVTAMWTDIRTKFNNASGTTGADITTSFE